MPRASDILLTHWDGTLPVKVVTIARRLGAAVRTNPALPACASVTRAPDDWVIEVNSTEASQRQRFAVAHCIGHLVLGHLGPQRPQLQDRPEHYSAQNQDAQEREANQFALELLLPAPTLRYAVDRGLFRNIDHLAGTFGVAPAAANQRLRALRLI